jgi:DNA-binding NarL/FixJ family response regulator
MTILIVDDHAAFRAAARRVLERHGYQVVGEAGDGDDALAAARALRPDVVLLDIQMPGPDGFEVAARLAAAGRPPAIVMVSSRDAQDFGGLIERSGACAFIPKHELSGPALDAALRVQPRVSGSAGS